MSFLSTLRLHSATEAPACVRSLRWHRLLSLTLLIAFLPSCFSWHEQGPTPEAAIKNLAPSTVRITRADRSKLTLRSPAVSGDSIVGQPVPAARSGATPRVAVPLGEVAGVATPRFNRLKTTGLVLATAGLAALLVCMAADCAYLFHEDPS